MVQAGQEESLLLFTEISFSEYKLKSETSIGSTLSLYTASLPTPLLLSSINFPHPTTK